VNSDWLRLDRLGRSGYSYSLRVDVFGSVEGIATGYGCTPEERNEYSEWLSVDGLMSVLGIGTGYASAGWGP